jgi:hypothetical protein
MCTSPATYNSRTNSCTCPSGQTYSTPSSSCVTTTCSNTQIMCGGTCYSSSSYTCASGIPTRRYYKRDRIWCPVGMSQCSVASASNLDSWECIDTRTNIESCTCHLRNTSSRGRLLILVRWRLHKYIFGHRTRSRLYCVT